MLGIGSRVAVGHRRLRAAPPDRGLRRAVRLRLTVLYGALFLVTGAVLLAITYELVDSSVPQFGDRAVVFQAPSGAVGPGRVGPVLFRQTETAPALGTKAVVLPPGLPPQLRATAIRLKAQASAAIDAQRASALDTLLTRSGLALAIMAFVSIGLGWVVAGRALQPLEAALESQRRFVANASHELRTPITLQRALVEVAVSDPDASIESLRTACERVLAASEHQEALIEALLTLARSQRGLVAREPLDLGPITAAVVGEAPATVESELSPAPTTGDPALVQRLVANLVDNAVRYNGAEGWVRAWTGVRDGRPTLEVSNTGPVIAQQDVEGLVEPFRRLAGGERSAERGGGLGLGLSIVDAIAAAHGARLTATPRAAGGLTVEVSFP